MKIFHLSSSSASHAGVTYDIGEDGSFDVPEAAAAELLAHGFTAGRAEEPHAKVEARVVDHAACLAALKAKDDEIAKLHAQLVTAEETLEEHLNAVTGEPEKAQE